MGLWNYRPDEALLCMSNDLPRTGHREVAGVSPEPDAAAKASRPKWRERLQRELFKIWLIFSALWVACILLILGQCLYGRWLGWQPAAMRRPARQSDRNIYCGFRHRIWPACRRATVVPVGHRSFETRSAQAVGIGHCPTAGLFLQVSTFGSGPHRWGPANDTLLDTEARLRGGHPTGALPHLCKGAATA